MKSNSKLIKTISRRTVLKAAAIGIGAAVAKPTRAQDPTAPQSAMPDETVDEERRLVSELGTRSPFEQPRRLVRNRRPSSNSMTPIQDLHGIITPSDLHYERHHVGVPLIDPKKYTLTIDGSVERTTTFTLSDLEGFISESRLYYVECGSNGIRAFSRIREDQTPQEIDGRTSTSEWTGVPLSNLFNEVGVKPGSTWLVAEGHDDGAWVSSIPIEKGWDDAMIAYGQNGEAVRPEQGYPARLLLPGWGAGSHVKWVRRIEVTDRPRLTEEQAAQSTESPSERAERMLSSVRGAKSIITYPAYPIALSKSGSCVVSGIAWSGRGRITRVDISADGGRTWAPATLQDPVFPKCHTRFRYPWQWDGREAMLMSRAVDDTGFEQPTLEEVRAGIEAGTRQNQNNNIRAWAVRADGTVVFGLT